MTIRSKLQLIRNSARLSKSDVAKLIGASLVSVDRWERGDGQPSEEQTQRIDVLLREINSGQRPKINPDRLRAEVFASRGARRNTRQADLFQGNPQDPKRYEVTLSPKAYPPLLTRLKSGRFLRGGEVVLSNMFSNSQPAVTAQLPMHGGMSAGKNTYTYDAHTYHTKVPPQGIAQFLRYYLPQGGIVLDPFAGSGMTGVAARALGYNVILNELSPAASFIADRFTSSINPKVYQAAVESLMRELSGLRSHLYSTDCRECGKETEILYTVWSYSVLCPSCEHEFVLWDHCRKYGASVREHKILTEFACPRCNRQIKKSTLKRTTSAPVLLGYRCCSRKQLEHPLSKSDLERLRRIEEAPQLAGGFIPATEIRDGVNLRQPKNHGLDRVDRFYTPRNLSAMTNLWQVIHRVEDLELSAFLAFTFTSLYQRVTKLSEFRFWGGSGNTARFNVPFIFNEANVFVTFERKARSIQDHLETTASTYAGRSVVACNSATSLSYVPSNSVDLVFTDPPFGANINYSEMNILWEAWLGEFTDPTREAIINKVQKKSLGDYQILMKESLQECYRVLRPGHWMLLVFMNSSGDVWKALRSAMEESGFVIERTDIFDKQHNTFKQFVSENTAGCDLVLHCRKPLHPVPLESRQTLIPFEASVQKFLSQRGGSIPKNVYLHVSREEDVDFRMLYSEWIAESLNKPHEFKDFALFRRVTENWLLQQQ